MVVENLYTPVTPSHRRGTAELLGSASQPGVHVLPLGKLLSPCSVSFKFQMLHGVFWEHEAFAPRGWKSDVLYQTKTISIAKILGEFSIIKFTREICDKTMQTQRVSVILHGCKSHLTHESWRLKVYSSNFWGNISCNKTQGQVFCLKDKRWLWDQMFKYDHHHSAILYKRATPCFPLVMATLVAFGTLMAVHICKDAYRETQLRKEDDLWTWAPSSWKFPWPD